MPAESCRMITGRSDDCSVQRLFGLFSVVVMQYGGEITGGTAGVTVSSPMRYQAVPVGLTGLRSMNGIFTPFGMMFKASHSGSPSLLINSGTAVESGCI